MEKTGRMLLNYTLALALQLRKHTESPQRVAELLDNSLRRLDHLTGTASSDLLIVSAPCLLVRV
jgi:hypothetical protein